VRATQFYDLVLMAMRFLDRLPVMVIPRGFLGQPIGAGEVAGRLVDLALSGPAGRAPEIGGPEVRTLAGAARGYLRVKETGGGSSRFPCRGRRLAGSAKARWCARIRLTERSAGKTFCAR
jgi:uncharacterized protein YbjT (DUF2867 family)